MSEKRPADLRDALILAGIEEINTYGANGLSLRRVATACHVSTAAPYKHFKDKKEFIAAIIDYVNDQWAEQQEEIVRFRKVQADTRRQLKNVRKELTSGIDSLGVVLKTVNILAVPLLIAAFGIFRGIRRRRG